LFPNTSQFTKLELIPPAEVIVDPEPDREVHNTTGMPTVVEDDSDNARTQDNVEEPEVMPPVMPSVTRKSSRVVIKPAWHQDYVTATKKTFQQPHSLSNFVSYQSISPKYKACLSKFSAVTEPKSYEEAMQDDKWIDAMQQKLQTLEDNGIWNLVPWPQGKPVIGCKWVFKIKHKIMVK